MISTTAIPSTQEALSQFLYTYIAEHEARFSELPSVEYDSNWRSPSESGLTGSGEQVFWTPTHQRETSLAGCGRALEVELHPDATDYFTSFWMPGVGATCAHGDLDLIGIWNVEDLENLQANIIGHALQQRRLNLPFTVFFATTLPESEHYLAIDNSSGEVVYEEAGRKAERVIASSLATFISTLQPRFTRS